MLRLIAGLASFAVLASASLTAQAASAGKASAAASCDRACLTKLTDTYLSALVAHDPSKAPLAGNIRFVENVTRLKPGEGLWKTASAVPSTFRIYIPDTTAQQVGFIGVMESEGKPVQLGMRLMVEGGKITEAEHIVVPVRDANNPRLQAPRQPLVSAVPDAYRDSRNRLLHIAASYYDALDNNNGSLAPFADDCVRYENGMQTVRNPVPRDPSQGFGLAGSLGCEKQLDTNFFQYIDTIDNRRVWIADEENGLAVGFSHFRHSMKTREFPVYGIPGMEVRKMPDQRPFDMPAMHVFKIWGGQIHEIEAVGLSAPYNSPTGWE